MNTLEPDPASIDAGSFDVNSQLSLLQAVLGAILRKYVPNNRKIELDLLRASREVDLDLNITADGKAKISWSDV